ncbi:MAG: hypothetical protein GXP58_09370 [Deltaproteobacteria bacterium]|nr:hypothetical protein [Deltaproteobacteria bacterium]
MKNNLKSLSHQLTDQINAQRGGGGKWPSHFDYTVDLENRRITLDARKKINKSGYRCLDSWGMALFHYVCNDQHQEIREIRFCINKNGSAREPNTEAFKRRVSFLSINNEEIDFRVIHNHRQIGLYSRKELFERPANEKIHTVLNKRGDDDRGERIEKDFQTFLFGKGLKTRTNDRLAILGEHFFLLKKKKYGVLREFPTGVFLDSVSKLNMIMPTEFVDIVTLNRRGYLSVIELKLDDVKLEVMSQLLDYALYFACYRKEILKLLGKYSEIRPKRKMIMCYVVNNRFHPRFDDVFRYYSTKNKSYSFRIFKVVLGDTCE